MTRFMLISIWIYVASLVVWFCSRAFMGDESIPVLLLNFFGIWFFFPLAIFGPWAVIVRQKTLISLLMIPLALFLFFYGSLFIPRNAPAASPHQPVTILTLNLNADNTNIAALLKVLNSSKADVFALQEVTRAHEVQLNASLPKQYAFHTYDALTGLAIYSIHPIIEQNQYHSTLEPIQSVILHFNRRSLHFINMHLARAGILHFLVNRNLNQLRELAATRENQIDLINQMIDETGLPAIVSCDCNMTNLNSSYSLITTDLMDAFQERGRGLGHTFLVPRGFGIPSKMNLRFQRIDYIFHSPEIRVHRANVIPWDGGSDHLALTGQFDLRP